MFHGKREVLEEEESRRTVAETKSVTFAKSAESWSQGSVAKEQYQGYCMGEEVLTREVWVKQARILVEQVRKGEGGVVEGRRNYQHFLFHAGSIFQCS